MYFLVERIRMSDNPPEKDLPDILVTPPPHAHDARSHDVCAVTPVDAQRRISLDPSGFVVFEEAEVERKQRRPNNNFYWCGCSDTEDGERDEKEVVFSERVFIPETSSDTFSFRKLWAFTGPGLLMSIGYIDPGNIESDLQSGSVAKYQLLWVLLWSTTIGLLIQRLAARLGTVSGLHLAEACKLHYPILPRLVLWVIAEIAVIGAEMQEVIGSAIAFYLLSNQAIPLWAGVILAVVQSFGLLLLEKYGVRKLEAVFGIMIAVMAISFGYQYVKVAPNQSDVIKGILIPGCHNCDKSALLQGIGIIGSVIMPHNLYLHSALVKSRDIDRSKQSEVREANRYYFIEAFIALSISFIINLFIVSVFANATWDEQGTFRRSNAEILQLCVQEKSPNANLFPNDTSTFQPNVYTGGIFLGCQYGQLATYIWAIGILAAGQSSTMTGAYAGQFVMEGFLTIKIPKWKRSLSSRLLVLLPPFIVAKYLEIDHLSRMNDYLNCTMSLLLPFSILPLVSMTSNEHLMGSFRNGKATKLFTSALVIFLIGLNMYFVRSLFTENSTKPVDWYVGAGVFSFGAFYICFCTYLFCHLVKSMGACLWSVEAVTKLMVVFTLNLLVLMFAYGSF